MEPLYNHNKGEFYGDDPGYDLMYDDIKVHKWPHFKSYEDRSNILTIEFSNVLNATKAKMHGKFQISMCHAVGYVWKKFSTNKVKVLDHSENSTIIIFEIDCWEEANIKI